MILHRFGRGFGCKRKSNYAGASATMTESNPMLGHRGSRLGITAPEIYTMQLRAIFAAMKQNKGKTPVEIMFPLIVDAAELRLLKAPVPPLAEQYGIKPPMPIAWAR